MTQPIDSKLVHSVDIVHVTMARGEKSITITSGVSAFVTSVTQTTRDAAGVHYKTRTVVFLKPDQTIGEKDEIVTEGEHRPVGGIDYCRDKAGLHHLEVTLA